MQIVLMGHTSSFMHLKKKLRYENDSSSFLFRLEIQISYRFMILGEYVHSKSLL